MEHQHAGRRSGEKNGVSPFFQRRSESAADLKSTVARLSALSGPLNPAASFLLLSSPPKLRNGFHCPRQKIKNHISTSMRRESEKGEAKVARCPSEVKCLFSCFVGVFLAIDTDVGCADPTIGGTCTDSVRIDSP